VRSFEVGSRGMTRLADLVVEINQLSRYGSFVLVFERFQDSK
jgi:hypothetical protein